DEVAFVHGAVTVAVTTMAMEYPVAELAVVTRPVFARIAARAREFILAEAAFVHVAFRGFEPTLALHFAALKVAAILAAVVVAQVADAPHEAVAEMPSIFAIREAQMALARHQSVHEAAFVEGAVVPFKAALAVELAVFQRAVIAAAIRRDGVGRGGAGSHCA